MGISQNDLERLQDEMAKGVLSAKEANVEMVRIERVRVVSGTIPREVRSALQEAVRNGKLGHKKKDKLRPEVFYHPSFEYMVAGIRNKIATDAISSIAKVSGRREL